MHIFYCFFRMSESATTLESSLRAYYRCNKVVRGNLYGDVLWTGPSKTHVLLIETNPREYLSQLYLIDTLKRQIFNSLKHQPFVESLLQKGDSLGMAHCEILYETGFAWLLGHFKLNQEKPYENLPISIKKDNLGPYAEIWITATLVINSTDPAHSDVPPIRQLLFRPPYNYGDTGEAEAAEPTND